LELPDDSAVAISSEGFWAALSWRSSPADRPSCWRPGDAILDTQSSVSLITLLMRFVGGEGGS
jgi:phospholipid/cholesterol/gamma-HCH transport system substrate-binding protein